MLQLKYDHRHTFFISLGVILLVFSFYSYYYEFIIIRHIIHGVSLLVAVISGYYGVKIWNKIDKEQTEMAKYQREEARRNIELLKLQVEEKRICNEKQCLEREFMIEKTRTKKLKQKVDKLENSIQVSLKNLEKREKELLDKKNKIFDEKLKSFSSLPLTFGNYQIDSSGLISYGTVSTANHLDNNFLLNKEPYLGKVALQFDKCILCGCEYEKDFSKGICAAFNGKCPQCNKDLSVNIF